MAQADEAERNMFDDETSQRLIIEEFGRCLKEIIESAHKAEATQQVHSKKKYNVKNFQILKTYSEITKLKMLVIGTS